MKGCIEYADEYVLGSNRTKTNVYGHYDDAYNLGP